MIEICAKTREPATVILDPVGVSVGLFDPASLAHLLGQLVEASRAQGHIIIFDEVQTFGGFLWPHHMYRKGSGCRLSYSGYHILIRATAPRRL